MGEIAVSESYDYCHDLMKTAARNFYFGMKLLPEAKRRGMYALYGYMRLIDDLADSPGNGTAGSQRKLLEQWRTETHEAIDGKMGEHAIWPALADTVKRFGIPVKVLDDAIEGQLQDLDQDAYATFEELYRYCYRVASTVGIAAIHIWGFKGEEAVRLAEHRGIAMQLTNILRDVREDAERGRRYLPTEDCERFECGDWPRSGMVPARVEELLRFEIERARGYYESSSALEEMVDADARATLRIMTGIYRGILERIAREPGRVLRERVGLSTMEKIALVLRYTWKSQKSGM